MALLGTSIGRSAGAGVVAAMAMTGMRRVTTKLGLVEETPPETMMQEAAGVLGTLSPNQKDVVAELAHWAFGGAGGALYGMLPSMLRRSKITGLLYGVLIWVGFEGLVAPALKVSNPQEADLKDKAALVTDHILYGMIVGGLRAPDQKRP